VKLGPITASACEDSKVEVVDAAARAAEANGEML
jgi:hypothetical protein